MGKLRPQAGGVWGRSLRRGRGLGSCDCPVGLFVHPVSGLVGQGGPDLQTGLPAAWPLVPWAFKPQDSPGGGARGALQMRKLNFRERMCPAGVRGPGLVRLT